ncbi:MAG: peptidase C10 family protein, partial [Bacteroidaceae bacterium]|nr:peptidase C10 family protein [Bacteroidaceae bacterium]
QLNCTATSTSNVGTYDIVISKGTVTNYNVTYVKGTLTIEKAPLTISGGIYTMKQGDALPELKAEYTGFKNGETEDVMTKKPTLTTTATSSSNPGEYEVTVADAEAQNYEISYEPGKIIITQTDRIENIELNGKSFCIYNLQGQRLRNTKKGINIINGKKVIVK